MKFWDQAIEISRIDLRVERRMGDVLRIILPFAVIALLVFPLALGVDLSAITQLGPAVFWAIGVLFGMQVALRQAADDRPERRDLYALLGVDPAARFVGRTMSGSVLMVGFMIVLLVATLVLYSPLPPLWLARPGDPRRAPHRGGTDRTRNARRGGHSGIAESHRPRIPHRRATGHPPRHRRLPDPGITNPGHKYPAVVVAAGRDRPGARCGRRRGLARPLEEASR